jgi:hypothetical protein
MNRLGLFRVLAAALAALIVSGVGRADERRPEDRRDEFDRLAQRLERQARELRTDLLGAFNRAPQHRQIEERLRTIEEQAARIHQAKERDERGRRVREALDRLDDEVRTLDRLIDDLGREREIDRRGFNRVRDDVREMRDTISRMRREL